MRDFIAGEDLLNVCCRNTRSIEEHHRIKKHHCNKERQERLFFGAVERVGRHDVFFVAPFYWGHERPLTILLRSTLSNRCLFLIARGYSWFCLRPNYKHKQRSMTQTQEGNTRSPFRRRFFRIGDELNMYFVTT